MLTVLMKNPNVLILDEPTNDLDILTLNVLEEYLKDFPGSLIIVSHDRFFLDKLADHLFIFEGNGIIKDFVGSYSGYRQYMKDKEAERKAAGAERKAVEAERKAKENSQSDAGKTGKRKLSYKEQRELEQLEKDLEALNSEKAALEEALSSGTLSTEELTISSASIGEVINLLDEKEMRWLELSDI